MLVCARPLCVGKYLIVLGGDVDDVAAITGADAAKAALYDAGEKGAVISGCIIPSPSPDLFYGLV